MFKYAFLFPKAISVSYLCFQSKASKVYFRYNVISNLFALKIQCFSNANVTVTTTKACSSVTWKAKIAYIFIAKPTKSVSLVVNNYNILVHSSLQFLFPDFMIIAYKL